MSSSVKPFSSIVNIAQLREEEAAAALADSIARKQQAEKQLVQLQNYLKDYKENQVKTQVESSQYIFKVKNEQLFIQRITFLIAKQEEEIYEIQSQITEAINEWKSNTIYNKVLNRLVDKYRDDATISQHRHEQKISDDYSSSHMGKKVIQ